MRIVLADDNDDHAYLIQMSLERAAPGPIEVIRARDGNEALALVEQEHPDLLLLDLNMPGRSGHQVLERLKGEDAHRRVPVAVLTSSDQHEDVARSYGLGGNHFLTKPADPADLERQLGKLLENLGELEGVRRGPGTIGSPGRSAIDPGAVARRRHMPWVVLLLAAALMFVAARWFGAL